ncbi:MAG: hypothetical protein HY238_18205 [Acidobacteria bacterium]|nr:hypothetical protein [Acidobacteriota bacterium]
MDLHPGIKDQTGQLQAHVWVEWQGEGLYDPASPFGAFPVPLHAKVEMPSR